MDRIVAAKVYTRICELGSLSAAARALDMSRPMVSRYLEHMERWAGERLLHRSSRKLTLTPAGERVLSQARSLNEVAEGITGQKQQDLPSGTLRVACSQFGARYYIVPFLSDFLRNYPDVRVELHVSSQAVNMIEERIDLAIRITNDLDPNIIARRLGECDSVLCASPAYIESKGMPRSPADLAHHNCLQYSYFLRNIWQMVDEQGEPLSVEVSGNFSANDSVVLMDAVAEGVGIAMLPVQDAQQRLDSGELVKVLEDCPPRTMGIYGIYRSRSYLPAALRIFLTALAERLAK
ncbi:LysR family transcriptional regulator [Cedecea sp. FDAARGOS_727]|uniref:LysR family transcriptional regulator n=1 Tax=Cedecea TaxID=158483 RepID=UPI00143EB893|nr:LysR family transcriptional regulator [Cedecea sp. FDAARGOS_727]QIX98258.1 LysR family transcriptional regulator [Cedecea sp. FDAARGOS_727]